MGYVRVSSYDQATDRQLDDVPLDRVFTNKVSGKDTERPQLQALLAYVREGDAIVVHSMDRLARNVDDLRRLVQSQTKRGVRVQFVKENLVFTGEDSPIADLMLSVLGAVAQFERDLIRESQREGIALARQRGVYRGRRKALVPDRVAELCRRADAGEKKALLRGNSEFAARRCTSICGKGRQTCQPAKQSLARLHNKDVTMGMFDYLRCELSMPDGRGDVLKDSFQTKSLWCCMDHFTITLAGRLLWHKRRYASASTALPQEPVHVADIDMEYHGRAIASKWAICGRGLTSV